MEIQDMINVHSYLLPASKRPSLGEAYKNTIDVHSTQLAKKFPPRSLTASLPLKNGGKGRQAFPIGFRPIFRGELLNFWGGNRLFPGSINWLTFPQTCPNTETEKMFGPYLKYRTSVSVFGCRGVDFLKISTFSSQSLKWKMMFVSIP